MRPLLPSEITKFLDRFNSFKESEIRSLKVSSPTEIQLVLTAQDKARGFDWITVTFLFNDIDNARLIDENKLSYVSMDDGITIINENQLFAFAVGKYQSLQSAQEAQLYLISKTIKYNESEF